MNFIPKLTLILGTLLLGLWVPLQAQQLTLEDCYRMAEENYPLIKQYDLIKQSGEYSVANVSKGYLPQVNVYGQATYQSDVTKVSIPVPGIEIPSVSKGQYKIYGEIVQPLTDIYTVKQQKELQETNTEVQQQNLNVELYKLKDRVNQLYFGILLLDEQVKQLELTRKDLNIGMKNTDAAIKNGVGLRSSLDILKAEVLNLDQKEIELRASLSAYQKMLGLLTSQPITDATVLERPASQLPQPNINRPELNAFNAQKKIYDVQDKLVSAKILPKFFFFVQAGGGQPSPVNLLQRDFSGYYVGGFRLNWSITSFYTFKNEKRINEVNRNLVDTQIETFLFNTNLVLSQQNEEVLKLQRLIATDAEIVALRSSIKTTSSVQLENGVITANDYLKEVNAEDKARQTSSLHLIQLLMAQYNYKTTSGN